jgi:hypothetical protein
VLAGTQRDMTEHEHPDPVSERDEEPPRRTAKGDIVGGETVGTEDTTSGGDRRRPARRLSARRAPRTG